jgi:WD40 repeat protein
VARRVRQYEAFISYSHAADTVLAIELQRTLNRIARPSYKWWQWWPPRVFRDQTNLAAASNLGAEIEEALLSSDSFVLLASTVAAGSPWVNREVELWCANKPHDRLFIALTDGTLAWDDVHRDFDRGRSNALPRGLARVFESEPLWVDFTNVRAEGSPTRDPGFLDAAATLAAAIRGTDKDAIVGEDVRQHRRTKQLVAGIVGLLSLLAAFATVAAIFAFIQRNHADERARLARSRELAARAVAGLDVDPEESLVLAARAATTAPTSEAESALRQALRSSRLRSVIDAGVRVLDAELDPSGKTVAGALADGVVRSWDVRTGRPVLTRRLGRGEGRSVSFSTDGTRMLAAGRAGAAVWSTTARPRRPLATFDESGPEAAALSPSGSLAATGDYDGFVRLWRADTGALVEQLRPPGPLSPVKAVAFSRDGSRLVAATGPHAVIWDLGRTRPRVLQSGAKDVWASAFDAHGQRVVTGGVDHIARVWSLRGAAEVELSGHEGAVTGAAFSPDGKLVVTASEDESARIWDSRTGRLVGELRGHGAIVNSAAFASDGKTIVTAGDDGTVRLWAVASDPVIADLTASTRRRLRDVGFGPGGNVVATAGEDLTARLWNLRRRRPDEVLRHGGGDDEWVESVAVSRDGRLVLTAGDDGLAKVWDASSGSLLETFGERGGPALYDAALSPDARLLAAGGGGPTVWVWRRGQRRPVMRLDGSAERIDGVAFSADGELIAAAGARTVHIWRAQDGSLVARLSGDRHAELTSAAFDPNGEMVAAGDSNGAASVWSVETRQLVVRVKGHRDMVTDVGFSADGHFLVTVGHDGLVNVWAVPSGHLVTQVRTPAPSLEGVAFARAGRRVAAVGDGGHLIVFDCAECRSVHDLVCLAATRVTPRVRARHEDAFRRCP